MQRAALYRASITAFMLAALGGCGPAGPREFPSVDRLTAGIFLEPEERAVLPPGTPVRPVYAKGLALTRESEGFRSNLYNDAASYCTIAYGHLVKHAKCDGTEPAEFLRGVSEPRGTELLVGDMRVARIAVMTSVDVVLTDGQFAALSDFVFNVGGGNFRSSTLRRVVDAGDFDQVPTQLRRWVKAGGRELPGLVRRREREIKLFFDGTTVPRALSPRSMPSEAIDIRAGESS